MWTLSLGKSAASFWRATPWEFWTMFEVKFADVLKRPQMTKERLAELMEQYPDDP